MIHTRILYISLGLEARWDHERIRIKTDSRRAGLTRPKPRGAVQMISSWHVVQRPSSLVRPPSFLRLTVPLHERRRGNRPAQLHPLQLHGPSPSIFHQVSLSNFFNFFAGNAHGLPSINAYSLYFLRCQFTTGTNSDRRSNGDG